MLIEKMKLLFLLTIGVCSFFIYKIMNEKKEEDEYEDEEIITNIDEFSDFTFVEY